MWKKTKRRTTRLLSITMWKVGLESLLTCLSLIKLNEDTPLDTLTLSWEKEKGIYQGKRELLDGDISVPRWVAGLFIFFYPLFPKKCLRQALTLYRHLIRFGLDPEIWIGVKKQKDDIQGHAWVVMENKILGEKINPLNLYKPIMIIKRGKAMAPNIENKTNEKIVYT